mmetsp:Transcript_19756/g.38679  ORF Transcript_19756/g.38679 Transcript_19756/m.38679 type:complete len:222 (+) Transcript_19756:487-1152(+)
MKSSAQNLNQSSSSCEEGVEFPAIERARALFNERVRVSQHNLEDAATREWRRAAARRTHFPANSSGKETRKTSHPLRFADSSKGRSQPKQRPPRQRISAPQSHASTRAATDSIHEDLATAMSMALEARIAQVFENDEEEDSDDGDKSDLCMHNAPSSAGGPGGRCVFSEMDSRSSTVDEFILCIHAPRGLGRKIRQEVKAMSRTSDGLDKLTQLQKSMLTK